MTRPNRQLSWPAAMLVIAVAGATPAAAQSPVNARVEVSANVGAQTGASTFSASNTLASNGGETETIAVDHGVKTALGLSVGAAVRLLPRFWVGAQYAMTEMKPSATLTAAIPHPILFDAPRTVEGSVNEVAHNQQNVHVALMYALPVHAVDVHIMGGPTFFKLKQDFVSGVAISETYPFDTAMFATATTKQLSETAVGFNAGADISRPLSSNIGIGALIRYSRADVKFDDPDIGQQSVKAGGFEVAGGVRLRF
jgi:opacity protein-like surface antigen